MNFAQFLGDPQAQQYEEKYARPAAEDPDRNSEPVDFYQELSLLLLHVRIRVIEKELIILVHRERAAIDEKDNQTSGENAPDSRYQIQHRHKPPRQRPASLAASRFPDAGLYSRIGFGEGLLTPMIIAPLAREHGNKSEPSQKPEESDLTGAPVIQTKEGLGPAAANTAAPGDPICYNQRTFKAKEIRMATTTVPEVPKKATPVTLTANAVAKVKEIMSQQNPVPAGLRIGVVGGGCSGFSYSMQFENAAGMMDKTFDMDGLKVFVDATSVMYLSGCNVDYVETLEGAGFKFENPNVKSTCGCGSSFSV
jgi:iron-sulfur cluster assembly accessory protein